MQLGLYLLGTKEECLALIGLKAQKEINRFEEECKSYQIFTGYESEELKKNPQHVPRPIKDTTAKQIMDLVVGHFKEHVEDLDDNDRCSLAFQISIHRRNYCK